MSSNDGVVAEDMTHEQLDETIAAISTELVSLSVRRNGLLDRYDKLPADAPNTRHRTELREQAKELQERTETLEERIAALQTARKYMVSCNAIFGTPRRGTSVVRPSESFSANCFDEHFSLRFPYI